MTELLDVTPSQIAAVRDELAASESFRGKSQELRVLDELITAYIAAFNEGRQVVNSAITEQELGVRLGLKRFAKDPSPKGAKADERSRSMGPQVRVLMFRLRRSLVEYFGKEGSGHRLRFEVPEGSYRLAVFPNGVKSPVGAGLKPEHVIAFIYCDDMDLPPAPLIDAVETALRPFGIRLVVANSHGKPDEEASLLTSFAQDRVRGVIVATDSLLPEHSAFPLLQQLRVPVVLVGLHLEAAFKAFPPTLPYVTVDRASLGFMVADYFLRKVNFRMPARSKRGSAERWSSRSAEVRNVDPPREKISHLFLLGTDATIVSGCMKALEHTPEWYERSGRKSEPWNQRISVVSNRQGSYEAMTELWKSADEQRLRHSAIFCGSFGAARGVLNSLADLQKRGSYPDFRIPIMAFTPNAKHVYSPQIGYVEPDIRMMGTMLVSQLMEIEQGTVLRDLGRKCACMFSKEHTQFERAYGFRHLAEDILLEEEREPGLGCESLEQMVTDFEEWIEEES